MTTITKPYLGSGKVYLRRRGASAGLTEVGNCSKLEFSVKEDVKTQQDFRKAGGGTYAEVRRVQSVEASMVLHDYNKDNLAYALFGTASSVVAGTVTGEAVTGYPGALTRLAHPNPTAVTVTPAGASAAAWTATTAAALDALRTPTVVNGHFYRATTAGTTGAAEPTWPTTIGATVTDGTVTWTCAGKTALVAGTDYEVRQGGVYFLAAAGIQAGAALTVDYSHLAYDVVQALTTGGATIELSFEGLNEADSNNPVLIDVWKLSLGASDALSLIGDNFGALTLKGTVQADATKGAGLSQYYRVQML